MLGKREPDVGLDSRFGSSGAGRANPTITTSESRVPLCGPANPVLNWVCKTALDHNADDCGIVAGAHFVLQV